MVSVLFQLNKQLSGLWFDIIIYWINILHVPFFEYFLPKELKSYLQKYN